MRRLLRPGSLLGMLLVVLFFFATPITLYRMVPLARREVAEHYRQAALYWQQYTDASSYTPYPYNGVLVDWRRAIAVDAVLRNQDFRSVGYSQALDAIIRFTCLYEWTEEECDSYTYTDPDTGEEVTVEYCYDVDYWRWVLKPMSTVMAELGFTTEQKEWAQRMVTYADLLVQEGIRCHYDSNQKKWVCA